MFCDTFSHNPLECAIGKAQADFTRQDLIQYIQENEIRMVNFRFIGGDGRLKTLNFVIHSRQYLDLILAAGERVDGSSLFRSIAADSSDLYVIPRYNTAFLNPVAPVPTLDILCDYYTHKGEVLPGSPEELLRSAQRSLKAATGNTLHALGELEFYLFSDVDPIYGIVPQKGYQESHPFSKWEMIRLEAMEKISQAGGKIKYGHAEVGNIIHGQQEMVQHEIEFLPVPVEQAADQLVIAKWILREVAYKHGLTVSFAPKIIVGHAGSGLHFHTRLVGQNGEDRMVSADGLSDDAKKMIAGYLKMAPSLSAFGNTVPTSYLRLVPHQEAPTAICWGDRNRATLVRVPLGWQNTGNMANQSNPHDCEDLPSLAGKQTAELRSPDGSANIHQLLAGMTIAAREGLTSADSLKRAEELYLPEGAAKSKLKEFENLPGSCFDAAKQLENQRSIYEKDGIFPSSLIDAVIGQLKGYQDKDLSERFYQKEAALKELVEQYIHCG